MNNLKEIKQAVVAYGLHLFFVREVVKMWAFSSKATTQDWTQFISAVLESGPQLLWRCFCKEEIKILEQQEKAKGLEISLDQILGEGLYSDPQDQALYDDHTLSLCSTAALKAWDRIQEQGKEVSHILGLNRVKENLLLAFYKDELRLYK